MPQRFFKLFTGWGNIMERITDFFAIFGVLSWLNPAVLEWISGFSTLAALLMPIFGCIWLAVQIYSRLTGGK
jgi:hypothetical protein